MSGLPNPIVVRVAAEANAIAEVPDAHDAVQVVMGRGDSSSQGVGVIDYRHGDVDAVA